VLAFLWEKYDLQTSQRVYVFYNMKNEAAWIRVKINLPTRSGTAVSIQLHHFTLLLYKEQHLKPDISPFRHTGFPRQMTKDMPRQEV